MTIILMLFASLVNSAAAFEACTPDNDYLENLLPPADPAAARTAFPQICVQAAQFSLPIKGFYGFCSTDTGRPARTHRRACISERYVSAVHSDLVDVTDCFNYDPRLAFATFNLESAAHLNAVGAATDVGIGQLTKSAIDEVNMNAFDRFYRLAKMSAKPSCQRILPLMTKHGAGIEERCGFMSLPENPTRNLIYSILLLHQSRKVITNLWNRQVIELPAAVDSERLKTMMTLLAYNAGPGGITSTLKAYSVQMGEELTDGHFDFERQEEGSFARYLNDNFPSADPAVRKRVSKYISHVIVAARRADRLAGGSQACLHQEYFLPPVGPLLRAQAPSRADAQRLIEHSTLKLAQSYTTCHDFEFAFLGRAQTARQLPEALREVHQRLCR